jgi:hypothetical protein
MNMHESFVSSQEMLSPATVPARSAWFGRLRSALRTWLKRCAVNYAAAASYEDLSRLSDAELNHRGLSRDILVRDLTAERDGTTRP